MHAARKGYRKALTLAEPQYLSVWVRLLGFKKVPDRAPTFLADGEQYIELFKEFGEAAEMLTENADRKSCCVSKAIGTGRANFRLFGPTTGS